MTLFHKKQTSPLNEDSPSYLKQKLFLLEKAFDHLLQENQDLRRQNFALQNELLLLKDDAPAIKTATDHKLLF